MFPILILAAASGADPDTIVVTASREPVYEAEAPASSTVFERAEIEGTALPFASDLLRLSPGVTVSSSGPRGTLTQVRIRGAEANHTLLFVDGIRFNDPAAGNEARFELLGGDGLSRLEVVRGPQSALWGSEALGGVVAAETRDPMAGRGTSALAEYGSLDSSRGSGEFAVGNGRFGISGSGGWIRSDGIDSFGGGERDGFDNRHASLKAVFRPLPPLELGVVGHWIEGESDYDGFDPLTFRRAETLDSTKNRIGAVRSWAKVASGGWTVQADGSWLGSSNRNRLAGAPLNRTEGERFTLGAQVSRSLGGHRFTAAVEHEAEDFRARDQIYFGGTDQDRSRSLTALVGEWRAEWSGRFSTDVAVRHDSFSAFADATTVRAAALFALAEGWQLHAAYGEGIAQPTFYDLYGFFPGSFAGNPALRPERSRGAEAGVRWSGTRASVGVTAFTARLRDEIVPTFDPATFLSGTANASGTSRRRGVEARADYQPTETIRLALSYTFLDAGERAAAGAALVKEVRRPRHSASLIASGEHGGFRWSATGAYVGKRTDQDFDLFPSPTVTLGDYLLASARVGYRLLPGLELYARAENAFNAHYQDVVGYRTPGRTVYAGIRLPLGL
jgi:vitamin B12 transporter